MQDWQREPVVIRKPDGSPVTLTDAAAERIVVEALRGISPYPIVAEEAMHDGPAPDITGTPFWLVDALDGTREFIRGTKDFTVNIALIDNGQPVFGVIHAPAHEISWHASTGGGAFATREHETPQHVHVRETDAAALIVLGGKRASETMVLEPFVGAHTIANRTQRGSSIKFCLVAEGHADVYSRPGQTYEWDTAAGDVILREAGGVVLDIWTRKPIVYGKAHAKFENGGFIAGSRAAFKF